jgi:hypothetical protein
MSIFNNGIEIEKIMNNGIEIDKAMLNGVEVFTKAGGGAWAKTHTFSVGSFLGFLYGYQEDSYGSIAPTSLDGNNISLFYTDTSDGISFVIDGYTDNGDDLYVSTATDEWVMVFDSGIFGVISSTLSALIIASDGTDLDIKLELK